MTKVSIIIPVYNSEKYLNKCLTSVCNQSLEDIEIIILNDASTDSSLDIIKSYEKNDSRIKVINMEINVGPGVLRNIGISSSNGEYIGFVDSDDYIDKDMYLELYNGIVKHETEIASSGFIKEICGVDYKKLLTGVDRKTSNSRIIETKIDPSFLYKAPVVCWNKLYKHDFIDKFKFIEDSKYEDYPIVIKMLGSTDRIFTLDKGLYHYRIRPNSITTSDDVGFDINTLDIFRCNDDIQKYYIDSGLISIFGKSLENIFLHHSLSKAGQIITTFIPFDKKKELINYFINLIDIKYGDWQSSEFYCAKKKELSVFGFRMNAVEKFFLDDSLRKETDYEIVKEKIKILSNKIN